ncbi:MAG: DUF748 domain-containing protein [Azoarcus sp.]|jgi:hypothetical protein|nr:DUF748 domain-containing protein [Azoarcus sp.]
MESSETSSPRYWRIGLPRLRRFLRPLLWIVSALAVYAALGFVVVPLLAEHYAPRVLGGLLGREVLVEAVGFNPFSLSVEFRGVKIMQAGKDGEAVAPAVELNRLAANFEILSLLRGGPVVRELAFERPRIRLVRLDAGRYDCSDVFERLVGNPAKEENSDPPRFSVANIHVDDGLVELDDRMTGTKHRVSELKLGLPFISSLPLEVDIFIEPDLSANLDGRPLTAKGHLKPFSSEGKSELSLSLKGFDLSPWLVYLPFEPTFRLPSGTLSLDLRLEFVQGKAGAAPTRETQNSCRSFALGKGNEAPAIRFQGRARIDNLNIQDRSGKAMLAVNELEAEFADIQPLRGCYYFSVLRLHQPAFDLVRLAGGDFNLMRLLPASARETAPSEEETSRNGLGKKTAETPFDLSFSAVRVRDGLIRYSDNAVAGGFSTRIEAINLDMRDFASSSDVPAVIRLDYASASGEKFSHQDRLRLKPPFEYDGNLMVEGFQPTLYRRYYADSLSGGEIRQGRVDGMFRFRVKGGAADGPHVEIGVDKLALSDFVFALAGRKNELLKFGHLALSDMKILPVAREIRVGGANAQRMALAVTRLRNGEYDFMSLMNRPPRAADPPWTFRLDNASVAGGSLRFEDRAAAEPAMLSADGIELRLRDFSTAKGAKGADIALEGRIGKEGRFALKGAVVPEPLRAELNVDLQGFALSAMQPYIARQALIGIRDGSLSAKGWLKLRERRGGLAGSLGGNLAVNGFDSVDRRDNSDFVRWREIAVRRARVDLEPFALAVDEVAIDGLLSRLILDGEGRLNLREIQRPSDEPTQAVGVGESDSAGVDNAEAAAPPSWPPVSVKRIAIQNSNIAFSDRFIRPNYNAFLGSLSGELTGLSSDQDTLAKLDLQGRVSRTAPLTVKGVFNPFRQDRHLDIAAEVKDFDLPALSGYSGRYVGYGISRGKLSATLDYRIENRKLSAENHVFLDQLTFGDAVESPDATHLPVRLAMSLLKNAHGEINVNLPVSGTLDDPEFSVFGLVLRAIAGLIGKAITAPFALLGREELSRVDFDPGTDRIGTEQEKALHDLAAALADRPSLKLDITGFASLGRDTEGIRREKLRSMVKVEKRRSSGGGKRGNIRLDDVELTDEEYDSLLGEVYDKADIRKPRNFIGLARTLPVAEMEKRLLESIAVSEEDIAALARRRESAVQGWLVGEGGIAPERVFQRTPTDDEIAEGAEKGTGVRLSLR